MAFVSNIKVGDTTNGVRAVAIPFGQVDSTSTSTAFTATIPGITELKDGVCVFLKNGRVTSASGCTLNINGLGAKPIYNTMATATAVTTTFNSGYTMLFVYDETRVSGGCWMMYYGYNSSGYTSNVAQGQCYGTCSTAVGTAAKTVTMSSYALVAHGICAIKFTNGNTAANPTLNINSKGAKAIYWNGAACPTNLIKPNDVVIMMYSTQYHIVGIYNGNRGFATTTPVMDGTGAIGTSTEYARADHVHPSDTSRAPVASPAFTGIPTAPTPSATANDQQIATTEWVKSALGDISGAMHFKGTALQTLTDGGTENAASNVSGSTYLGDAGDVYLQYNDNTKEYVWTGSVWEELGNEDKDIILLHATPTGNALNGNPIFDIDGISSYSDLLNLFQSKIVFITADSYSNYTKMQILEKNNNLSNVYTNAFGADLYAYDLNCLPRFDIDGGHCFQFSVAVFSESGSGIFFGDSRYFIPAVAGNGYKIDVVSKQLILDDASTSNPGIVSLGTNSTQAAQGNHTHGNISNTGTMTATASVSPGDKIVIGQNSTGTLILGPEFSTVTTNFLNSAGNWTVPVGDHKVTQAAAITTNGNYPILLGNTTATTDITATVNKASTLVYNPSTKKLLVNSATVATTADIPTWTVS